MPYAEMYELMPEAPASVTFVTRNLMGDELDDRAIDAILAHMEPSPLPSEEQAKRSGHGPALDDWRIPQPYVGWKVEMTNQTGWRFHERAMMRAVIGRGGWTPGLTFNADDLSSLSVPVLMVCGTSDPGFEGFDWEGFVAQIPDGAFYLLDDAGHEPWFEDPEYVANSLRGHFKSAVE